MRFPIGIPFRPRFLLSLSLSQTRLVKKASDNLAQKPLCLSVPNLPLKNLNKYGVVHGVKKLLYVAFQNKAPPRIIPTYFPYCRGEKIHSFVCTLADTAGKRSGNKGRFKNWIKRRNDSVMQNPIPHCRFMNPPPLRVINPKGLIGSVADKWLPLHLGAMRKCSAPAASQIEAHQVYSACLP